MIQFKGGRCLVVLLAATVFLFGFLLQGAADEPLEEKVEKYILQGDYEGAIDMLKDYIDRVKDIKEKKKNLGMAYYHLARTYFQTGFDQEAEDNLKSAYIAYPRLDVEQQENDLYFKERALKVKENVTRQIAGQTRGESEPQTMDKIRPEPREETVSAPEPRKEDPAPPSSADYARNLDKDQARTIMREKGLYDRYLNRRGSFDNRYEMVNQAVVRDRATGLMWMVYGSEEKVTMEEARQWLERQNQQRFSGYDDWRLPTLQEAQTLVEEQRALNQKAEYWKKLNIDPLFGLQDIIWTGDRENEEIYWIVNFDGGFAQPHDYLKSFEYKFYVRAVRSGE